jgi:hypothetical protein
MSEDSKLLSSLRYVDSEKKIHRLEKRYHKLFLSNGTLNLERIRHVFMCAGILSRDLQDRESCAHAIQKYIVFLNKYKD